MSELPKVIPAVGNTPENIMCVGERYRQWKHDMEGIRDWLRAESESNNYTRLGQAAMHYAALQLADAIEALREADAQREAT